MSTVIATDPEVVQEISTDLVHISVKNTRQPTQKQVIATGLPGSIEASGQLTPGLGRPHPDKPGHIELAAGARRYIACQYLSRPYRVIVREMTDDEFEDAILTENLQREDPDPEAEADLIKRRLDEGGTPSEIAARYGKTESWVKRRMKLLDVIPAIRKRFTGDLALYTIEMRERIGSLPKEMQKSLNERGWQFSNARSMGQLENLIREQSADLKGCKTILNDPDTFVEGCGPGCATDSSNDLFSDGKGCGRCQNTTCFFKRMGLARDKAITEVLEGRALSDFVLFTSDGYARDIKYQGKELKVLDEYDHRSHYTVSKKKTELLGLDFKSPHKPVIVFLERRNKNSGAAVTGGKDPGKKEPRENPVIAKRRAAINVWIVSNLEKAPRPGKPGILVLVGAFGTHRNRDDSWGDRSADWTIVDDGKNGRSFDHFKENKQPIEDALWESVRIVLRKRLAFQKNGDLLGKGKEEEMRRTAGLIGLDYDAEYARICTDEVKVPKSWGPGIDPITLKPVKIGKDPAAPSPAPAKKDAKKAAKKAVAKKAAKKAAKKS